MPPWRDRDRLRLGLSNLLRTKNRGLLLALLLLAASAALGMASNKAGTSGSPAASQPHQTPASASAESGAARSAEAAAGERADLGATAAGLLDPRSWDIAAPLVILEEDKSAHNKKPHVHLPACKELSSDGSHAAEAEACPSHLHHSRYLPGAPLGPALDLMRGAAGALARKLAALRAAVGRSLHGAEEAAARAVGEMGAEMRSPEAWEENPWVAREVNQLLEEREQHAHETHAQAPEQALQGGASEAEVATKQQQQQKPKAPLQECPAALRAGLAAAAGVDRRVRALMRELRDLVRTLERLAGTPTNVGSPCPLQPLADGLSSARHHMDDLKLELETGLPVYQPDVTAEPARGEQAAAADNGAKKTDATHGAPTAEAPPAVAVAALGPWLVAVVERAGQELGTAEDLVRSALGYGKHGAGATAHSIMSDALVRVHDALLLLRDTAAPPPLLPSGPGTASAAAAAAAAPIGSAKRTAAARGGVGGGGDGCSELRMPATGLPPEAHLPTLGDLPPEAADAARLLLQLPPATLVVVGRDALVEARDWALRLRNLAAFPAATAQTGSEHPGAGAGSPAAHGSDEALEALESLNARYDAVSAIAEAAAFELERLAAAVEGTEPATAATTSPDGTGPRQHACAAVEALLACRDHLTRWQADQAGAGGAAAAGASGDGSAAEGEEGGKRLLGLLPRPLVQAVWSRAVRFVSALGLTGHSTSSHQAGGNVGEAAAGSGAGGAESAGGKPAGGHGWFSKPAGAHAQAVPVAVVDEGDGLVAACGEELCQLAFDDDAAQPRSVQEQQQQKQRGVPAPDSVRGEGAEAEGAAPGAHVPAPPALRLTQPLRAVMRRTGEALAAAHDAIVRGTAARRPDPSAGAPPPSAQREQALVTATPPPPAPPPPAHEAPTPLPEQLESDALQPPAPAAMPVEEESQPEERAYAGPPGDAGGSRQGRPYGGGEHLFGGVRGIADYLWAPLRALRGRMAGGAGDHHPHGGNGGGDGGPHQEGGGGGEGGGEEAVADTAAELDARLRAKWNDAVSMLDHSEQE
ncbi:hypothetical protein GPECTOR_518g497 [Gonium pectorale]|uniref:Uncharacterized protein n=1 Tax=Gonium pectorale TaxID=33097 RepID=A0A150FUU3_GONPE|nr:hypothetical protein GPECTOR_518g497 [Gonium pectorale]|eukprot:KXZ41367.1 hypothetical protein GPECTOR_518g497 [Gonium pectorale]